MVKYKERLHDEVQCTKDFFGTMHYARETRAFVAMGVVGCVLTIGGVSMMTLEERTERAAKQVVIEEGKLDRGIYGFFAYATGLFLLHPPLVYFAGFRYGRRERRRAEEEQRENNITILE